MCRGKRRIFMLLLVLCEVTFELRKVRCLWCYGTQRKNEDFAICYSWGSYQHRTPESIHWVSMGRKHATPPPIPATLLVTNLDAQNYDIHNEISRIDKPLTISTFPRNTNRPLNIIQYQQQPCHTTGLKYSRATPRHLSSWSTQTTYQGICSCILQP